MTISIGLDADNLFQKLPFGPCVNRVRWISERCAGLNVLDIGCLDETAFAAKKHTTVWLHGEIRTRAKSVLGIDSSSRLPELKREHPDLLGHITQGDVAGIDGILEQSGFSPDIIVCGELIEHLPAPGDLFRLLSPVMKRTGARLLITTPNPFAYQSFLLALLKRESQHVDHLSILSPKILLRTAERSGLKVSELLTAYTEYNEFMARPGGLKFGLAVCNSLLFRPFQWLFPSTAGTLILILES